MQLSKFSKHLIILLIGFGITLFLLYPATIVDYEQYQDQRNYLKGFQAIRFNGWRESYDTHFGGSSELLLPFLYLLSGAILDLKTVAGIIGLNHFIFSLSLSILIVAVVTNSARLAISISDTLLISLMIVTLIPLGAPSQLSRQAIAVVLLLSLVFAVPSKWRLLAVVITPLLHVGSVLAVLTATYVDRPKKYVRILAGIVLTYIAVVFFVDSNILFSRIQHPTLQFRTMSNGMPISFTPALFVSLYLITFYRMKKFHRLTTISFLILSSFYPMIFFQRVFWGQIFVLIPVFLYVAQLEHSQKHLILKNQILAMIFFLILLLKTFVIAI